MEFQAFQSATHRYPTTRHPVIIAAAAGHLDVILWILRNISMSRDFHAFGDLSVSQAAQYGRLEVLRWFNEQSGAEQRSGAESLNQRGWSCDLTIREYRALRFSAENGHVEVLKYAIEESGKTIDCRGCEKWFGLNFRFQSWNHEVREYLQKIKSLQTELGIDSWSELVQSRRATQSTTKRRV